MNEPVRCIADGLRDADHGINAQLAAMVSRNLLDAGDTTPADLTVYDDTRDDQAALGRSVDNVPQAIVFLIELSSMDPADSNVDRDDMPAVGVRFDTQGDGPALSVQDLGYYIRATRAALRWLFRANDAWHYLVRNDYQLLAPTSINVAHFQASPMSDKTTIGVKLVLQCRDGFDYA